MHAPGILNNYSLLLSHVIFLFLPRQPEHQEYGTDNEDDEYDGYMAEENKFLADKHKHALNDHVVDVLELDEKYEVPADLLHDNDRPKNKELIDSAADIVRLCREYGKKYENEDEDKEVIIEEESSDESEKWDSSLHIQILITTLLKLELQKLLERRC